MAVILLITLIVVGDLVSVMASSRAPTILPLDFDDGTQLGTWYNMPANCSSQDACMLFGNQSLVQVFPFDGKLSAGAQVNNFAAYLSVGCIRGSNSPNPAYLQLQYAMYAGTATVTSGLPSNATNWQNISRIYINTNGTYLPCQDTSVQPPSSSILTGAVDTNVALNVSSVGWVFRVIGANGGGPGDNPRFSFVDIKLENLLKRVATISIFAPTATLFQYAMEVNIGFTTSTAVSFQWIADNITSGGCGIPVTSLTTYHCWENGSGSCTFAVALGQCPASGSNTVNFGIAFASAVSVKAVAVTRNNLGAVEVPFSSITLFATQPVTV